LIIYFLDSTGERDNPDEKKAPLFVPLRTNYLAYRQKKCFTMHANSFYSFSWKRNAQKEVSNYLINRIPEPI
jgi:hypothetical protein